MTKKEELAVGESHPFDSLDIGDQVSHPKWGIGTILFRSGTGESAKVIVVFPEEGQKKLALKYAKLKKVQDAKASIAAKEAKAVKAPDVVEVEKLPDEEEKEDVVEVEDEDDSDDDDEILLPEDVDEDISFGDDVDEKNLEVLGADDEEDVP